MTNPYGNLQSDKSQRLALGALVDGTSPSMALKQDAIIPANALGPGSAEQTVTEALRDRVTIGPAGHQILAMWRGTQAEYDALGGYSATTLYVIVG